MGDTTLEERKKEAEVKALEAEAKQKEAEARKAAAEADSAEAEVKQKEVDTRKAAAEADKAETEAKDAKTKSETPSGETKPTEGKVTADEKAGYIATFAAYNAMIQKAAAIAKRINTTLSPQKSKIVIVDTLDFCISDAELLQITTQIELIEKELENQVKRIQDAKAAIKTIIENAPGQKVGVAAVPAVAAALPMVKGIISSLADIFGYLKTDYEIKGQTVALSNIALHSLVAGQIEKKSVEVYLPGFHRIKSSQTIEKLANCMSQKATLQSETEELKKQLDNPVIAEKKKEGSPAEKEKIKDIEKTCEFSGTLLGEFSEFYKALVTTPTGKSFSPLVSAIIRQHLNELGITHLLYLAVTSSGGEMVTGKGLFQWGTAGFLGGCVVTYILAECSGKIVDSDTSYGYSSIKYNLCRNRLSNFSNQL